MIGVAVPTRAFCAPLVALGAVTDQADKRIFRDKHEHFELLCQQPKGTPVSIQVKIKKRDRVLEARIEGTETKNNIDGKLVKYVRVKPTKGRVYPVSLPYCHKVKLAASATASSKDRQVGKLINDNSGFSKHFFSEEAAEHGALGSSRLCAVVGNKHQLEHEFRQQKFSVKAESHEDEYGVLQDVAKVKSFGKDSEQFLSEIFAPTDKRISVADKPTAEILANADPLKLQEYPIIVFDGCRSFLKHKVWKHQNFVVILDRTDSKFDDAVEEFNRQFMRRVVETNV